MGGTIKEVGWLGRPMLGFHCKDILFLILRRLDGLPGRALALPEWVRPRLTGGSEVRVPCAEPFLTSYVQHQF